MRRRKRGNGVRFAITAVTLVLLVTVFAWTLKHKKIEGIWPGVGDPELEFSQTTQPTEQDPIQEGSDQSSDAGDKQPQEELQDPEQNAPAEGTADPGQNVPAEETENPEQSVTGDTAESPEQTVPVNDPEAQRASFDSDYLSAPLLSGTPIKYLTVQQGAAPGELRFNWFSPHASKAEAVIYNTATGETATVKAQTGTSATEPGWYYHKAVATGLTEQTTYTYKVGSKDGWSPEYSFTTKNFSGDFTFMITSDAQIGQSQMELMEVTADRWDRVVTRINKYVPESAFLMHLGDQVAGYNDVDQYRGFFEHLALYQMPLVPVVGNHDVDSWDSGGGPWFYERYHVPNRSNIGCNWADTDGDYWFRYGNALFMVLNSNTLYGVDVHEEFVDQVCAANPDAVWRIILAHQSAYTSVEKYQFESEQCRDSYAYMGELYDIDLFLSGHDHIYTRTAVMDYSCTPQTQYDYTSGAVIQNPNGPIYVNCSTSSGSNYQPIFENYAAVFQGQPEVPVVIRADVTDTTLKLTTYLADSWEVYDEITLQK